MDTHKHTTWRMRAVQSNIASLRGHRWPWLITFIHDPILLDQSPPSRISTSAQHLYSWWWLDINRRSQRCNLLWAWPSCPWLYVAIPLPPWASRTFIIHLSPHARPKSRLPILLRQESFAAIASFSSTISEMDLLKKMAHQELPLYARQSHVPSDSQITLYCL